MGRRKRKQEDKPKRQRHPLLEWMRARLPIDLPYHKDFQVTKVESSGMVGGATVREKRTGKLVEVKVPVSNSASGRTIRLHESMHAIHKNKKFKGRNRYCEATRQLLDDIVLHYLVWPVGAALSVHRDCLATAVRGCREVLKSLKSGAASSDPMVYNMAVYEAVRGLIIWNKTYTLVDKRPKRASLPQVADLFHKVARGLEIYSVPAEVIDQLTRTRPRYKNVADLLESLWERGDTNTPWPKGDSPDPDKTGPNVSALDAMDPLVYHKLSPMREHTEVAKARRTRRTSFGSRLNMGRIASCIASNSLANLFKHKKRQPVLSGSILIDSSGSMHFDDETLAALVAKIPAATIAYYQGCDPWDLPRGKLGMLVQVAEDGRRYTSKLPWYGGGNNVDYWALRWLLKQEPPLVFVTDTRYCGGPHGQEQATHRLEKRSRMFKRLTVVNPFSMSGIRKSEREWTDEVINAVVKESRGSR
jgi:hypothetical protein